MAPVVGKSRIALKYGAWILAGCALAWSLLPYVLASQPFLHSQTYAAVIVVLLIPLIRMVIAQLKAGVAMIAPREETIALSGVSLALVATLLCCLLAPSTVVVHGVAGKTLAIPEHEGNLQFPLTAVALNDAQNLAVQLHLDREHDVTVGGRMPLLIGDMMLWLNARPVATIAARGIGGDELTITQPVGGVFLSPMLLFPKITQIADLPLPADQFAIPARNVTVRAFLVTNDLMHDPRVARMSNHTAGVLFAVDDAAGRPLGHGIGFAADGLPEQLGPVVLMPKLGYFPDVTVASEPEPIAMAIGIAAFVFGGLTLAFRKRRMNIV